METSRLSTIDVLLMAARFVDEQEDSHTAQEQPLQQQQHVQPIQVHRVIQPLHQHVTIQPLPPQQQQQPATMHNNHITTFTMTQQVNAIRTIKKDLNLAPSVTSSSSSSSSSSPPQAQMNRLSVMNSFDIINPPVIDQGSGEVKRKQPPMAFRTGTREVHNKLEKNRRAHLKECFDVLYATLPNSNNNKKTSNLNILGSAIKYISSLEAHQRNNEQQMEMLAKEKINLQQKFVSLKKDIMAKYNVDVSLLMPEIKTTAAATTDENVRLKAANDVDHLHHDDDNNYVQKQLDTLTTTTISLKQPPADSVVKSATLQPVVNNVLKLPKSITGALPVVATATTNGIKEDTTPTPAATVLPFGYPMNHHHPSSLVVQKVIVSTSPQLTHFIATSAQPPTIVDGKVLPTIVNAQYVVKPLVVVSTPSRPS